MSEDGSTDRAIGRLEGQMTALTSQIAQLAPAIEASRAESSAGRSRIYGELEAVRGEIAALKTELAEVKAEMASVKETNTVHAGTIRFVNVWKERMIGMMALLSFLSAATGVLAGMLWKWVLVKLGLA